MALALEANHARAGLGGKLPGAEGPAPAPVFELTHEHLKQLGIKHFPPAGSTVHIHASVAETHATQDPQSGEQHGHIVLHLHKMDAATGKQPEMSDASQAAGAKAEIDKALTKAAGSEAAKGKPAGKTPTPRGGGD